jgi:transposase-like protein
MVLGAIQREGKLKTKVIPKVDIENVNKVIKEFIAPASIMVTDESNAYNRVKNDYEHRTINHRNEEYVRQEDDIKVHTNSIESYWNILCRFLS